MMNNNSYLKILYAIVFFVLLIPFFCFAQQQNDIHKGLPPWFSKNPLHPGKQTVDFSEWNDNGEHSFNIKENSVVVHGKIVSFTYYPKIHGDSMLEFYRKKIKNLGGEILFNDEIMSTVGKYKFDGKEYWVEIIMTMYGKECNVTIVERAR